MDPGQGGPKKPGGLGGLVRSLLRVVTGGGGRPQPGAGRPADAPGRPRVVEAPAPEEEEETTPEPEAEQASAPEAEPKAERPAPQRSRRPRRTRAELEQKTVKELYALAREANLEGRSRMSKEELVAALATDGDVSAKPRRSSGS